MCLSTFSYVISKPTAHAADPVILIGIGEFRLQCSSMWAGTVPGYERIILKSTSRDHRRHWGAIVVKVLLVFVSDCVEG